MRKSNRIEDDTDILITAGLSLHEVIILVD